MPRITRPATSSRTHQVDASSQSKNADIDALLAQWEQAAIPGEGEQRDIAVQRIKECRDTNGTSLDLSELSLTSLPAWLPPHLTNLSAYDNKLVRLSGLPERLESLDVASNQFSVFPANLPESIELLSIQHNEITEMPRELPNHLRHLIIHHNAITQLPSELYPSHTGLSIDIEDNPLSNETLSFLSNRAADSSINIHFTRSTPPSVDKIKLLAEEAERWLGTEMAAPWQVLQQEENAPAFAQFLYRLRYTTNKDNPGFKQQVVSWLQRLAQEENAQVRALTFIIALDATSSCEDRVTLHLNQMQALFLAADVDRGAYDDRLAELIQLGKGMYRQQLLDDIAQRKVYQLEQEGKHVDAIEIYLAFPTKLHKALGLPGDALEMRFFDASGVSEEDLNNAKQEVLTKEPVEFPHYLATDWQPWQSTLKRLYAEHYDAAQDKLIDTLTEQLDQRIDEQIKTDQLPDDLDVRARLGAAITRDIRREIMGKLTADFLQEKQLSLS